MKKLAIVIAMATLAISVKAASVDWKVNGAAAQENYSVYLLTSLESSYASVDALAAAAVGSATITKSGRNYTTGTVTSADASITKASMENAYLVIVSSSSASSYNYVKADLSAYTYDVNAQETAPTTPFGGFTAAQLAAGTSANFAAVPEPTSGLLMLLGVAGLALRRRRA